MQVDAGASASIMSENTYRQLWGDNGPQLQQSNTNHTMGSITVQVAYRDQRHQWSLLIIKGNGPTLFGRKWLDKTKLE